MRSTAAIAVVAFAIVASCTPQNQGTIVVSLEPQQGPTRLPIRWLTFGPATEAFDGDLDLSDETLTGLPDTLSEMDVRFIDFQWQLVLSDAFAEGRIDSTEYRQNRDPTVEPKTVSVPIDQHVHYVVGRQSSGNFVVIVDTDNDEDLSDETAAIFPWQGPPQPIEEFFAEVRSQKDYFAQIGALPTFPVHVQLLDGDEVLDATFLLSIAPHLAYPRAFPPDGEVRLVPGYMIGTSQNMVGTTSIDGNEFTFWASTSRLGLYPDRDTQFWFEEGDQRAALVDSIRSYPPDPYLIGQVIEIHGRFFRLDDISLNGARLRLVEVDNMPGVGIRVGQDAPEFSTVTADGNAIKLSDYRGKFVLLDFWSTTCGPCLRDMPAIKKVYSEFDRNEFEIIGIAQDDRDWLLKFIADNNIPWPQITQSQASSEGMEILERYKVTGIPAYFLIDPAGKIVDPNLGIHPSDLDATLRSLLASQN